MPPPENRYKLSGRPNTNKLVYQFDVPSLGYECGDRSLGRGPNAANSMIMPTHTAAIQSILAAVIPHNWLSLNTQETIVYGNQRLSGNFSNTAGYAGFD